MGCNGTLVTGRATVGALVGMDPAIVRVRQAIEQVAPTAATVLLSGEAGTGKSLAARAIHAQSRRVGGPFVRLHCAGLAEAMLGSALFGADACASDRRAGRLAAADGGTLFLEEIAEIPLGIQGRLLRFLRERALPGVAGRRPSPADVRLVVGTRRKLSEEVVAGRFREDLFRRLCHVHIELPPLRERRCDIELLAHRLLAHFAEQHGRPVEGFTPEAIAMLLAHPWPGNARELESAVEQAVVKATERWIGPAQLAPSLGGGSVSAIDPPIPGSTLADIERMAILRTLAAVGGSTSRAAAMLGISTRKVQYRVREYREVGLLGDGPAGASRRGA